MSNTFEDILGERRVQFQSVLSSIIQSKYTIQEDYQLSPTELKEAKARAQRHLNQIYQEMEEAILDGESQLSFSLSFALSEHEYETVTKIISQDFADNGIFSTMAYIKNMCNYTIYF